MRTVDTDTKWSELDPTPTLNSAIEITNGATLTLDVPGKIQLIEIVDGTFEMETLADRSFADPTLLFGDEAESGLIIQNGEVTITDTPAPDETVDYTDQEDILRSMNEPRQTVVVRNDYDVRENSVELAENRWFFFPQNLEWSLHNYHLLETYNIYPLITYWEQTGTGAVQRTITFDCGITEMEREKEIDLHKNTIDGGSEIQLTYDRTSTKEWRVSGIFDRRYSGKAKLKGLYHLADTLQRDSPVLLVTDEMIKYVMVKNVDHELEDNFYEWEMVIEEQKYPAADRIEV
ncbi:MAG: hypothetical protein ACLFU5_09470 [Thermoplasmata archaeon]